MEVQVEIVVVIEDPHLASLLCCLWAGYPADVIFPSIVLLLRLSLISSVLVWCHEVSEIEATYTYKFTTYQSLARYIGLFRRVYPVA